MLMLMCFLGPQPKTPEAGSAIEAPVWEKHSGDAADGRDGRSHGYLSSGNREQGIGFGV